MKSQVFYILLFACVYGCAGYYFNDYVYAQQWPASFCFSSDSPSKAQSKYLKEHCSFPNNITTWTNHGLWPSVNESYPSYCNDSWHLKPADIASLEDEMRARWPSFEATGWSFWKHEWSKHGTCASNVSSLNGPLKYFSYALMLNEKYNLLKSLNSVPQNLVPVNDHCYSYADFVEGTRRLFNESVLLGCTYNTKTKQQHIAQIEICFDKKFNLKCDPNTMRKRMPHNYGGEKLHAAPEVIPCKMKDICYFSIPH